MSANLQTLAAAQENLAFCRARLDGYDGNNPNKHRSDVQHAQADVAQLTQECKDAGLIELTELLHRACSGLKGGVSGVFV